MNKDDVNKKCKGCKKKCKQPKTAKVVVCNSYDPIDGTKPPIPESKPKRKRKKKVDEKPVQ